MRKDRWVIAFLVAVLGAAVPVLAATYFEDFENATVTNDGSENVVDGWTGDGAYYATTGGVGDSAYKGGRRASAGPYHTPLYAPAADMLMGDLPAHFGSDVLTFSYYLKAVGGSVNKGGELYMFADSLGNGGWDDLWLWTPDDTTVPADWTKYEWTIDTTDMSKNVGGTWSLVAQNGTGQWADGWHHVAYWNFWTTGGSNVDTGIDNVSVTPEPASLVLLVLGAGLLRRRRTP